MRGTRRRDSPLGCITFDVEKSVESSDEDDGDVYDYDVNDVELFDMLVKVRDPSLKTSQVVASLVDKYANHEYNIDIIKGGVEYEKKLDEYFNNDDKLSEYEKCFLKEYFRKKLWICKDDDGLADIDSLLEDEIDMLRQESYEAAYNLRYEEYGEEYMRVHSRYFEDSIRELEDAREREREKMAQAEIERIEEVKRLKEEETQNEDERKQSRKKRRYLRLHEVMFRPSRRLAYNVFINLAKKKRTKA